MTYSEKLWWANGVVKSALTNSKNPVVMCSFGKDSIVVLHLVRQFRKLKVIFHRESVQHHKYEYANRLMREWDLHVIDYPPSGTALSEGNDHLDVVNFYQVGSKTIYLPTELHQQDNGRDTVCALSDIYGKMTGTVNYPFDLIFHGHKASDSDPILGKVPIFADVALNAEAPHLAYPIRHFTDEDVWRYIEENDIPTHHERYVKKDGVWGDSYDKTQHPHYVSCCYSCMSKNTGNNVHCPKWGLTVSNVSSQLRWAPKLEASYLKG